MSRGLDVAKAEAALKRAAYKALHGTPEERSGRFVPLDKGRESPRDETRSPSRRDAAKRKA